VTLGDRLLRRVLPAVPRAIVGRVARRYVAGETIEHAVAAVRRMAAEGATSTVALLGEHARTREQARRAGAAHLSALDTLAAAGVEARMSVKLTALGLLQDAGLCRDQLAQLAERAAEHGGVLRIDMEDHRFTEQTLALYRELSPRFGNLGVVLQSALHRSRDDARQLAAEGADVRLCKGIYREPASVAFQRRSEVRQSFRDCLAALLDGAGRLGVATHDEPLLREAICAAAGRRASWELQVLLGVRPALRRELLGAGHPLRVYVPYGVDWYAYSMRRLQENPTIAKHVIGALLRRG